MWLFVYANRVVRKEFIVLARLRSLHQTIATFFARIQRPNQHIRTRMQAVPTVEVEQVLRQHLAVADAAVFEIFDLFKFAHALHAVVSKKSDAQLSPDELVTYCRIHLPEPMIPVQIEIRGCMLKNGYGVVDKIAISRHYLGLDMFPPAA